MLVCEFTKSTSLIYQSVQAKLVGGELSGGGDRISAISH
jgi:hypothetical protein